MHSTSWRAVIPASLLLGLLSLSTPALAETTPEDRASADQLYNDASRLMSASKYAEACPKLSASQKLDPAIGTLLKLGFCFTYTGQTASAWASFNDAEAMARKAGDRARGDEAAKRARELEPKLSKLVIESAAAEVEVRRDGAVVDHGVLGTALPVDPGAHAITASAAGKEPWSGSVTVAPGPGTTTLKVPALAAAAVAAVAVVDPAVGVVDTAAPAKTTAGWSTQRKVALGVGSVGVAGVIVGAVFGGLTLSKTSAASGHCGAGDKAFCDADGVSLYASAKTTARVSDIALAAGGAAVIGGVVLFLIAPADAASAKAESARLRLSPAVGPGAGGIFMQGVW